MSRLVFIDTEATGLDARIHQPYEVSWWPEHHENPTTITLPHTLDNAQDIALEIGGYHQRGFTPGFFHRDRWDGVELLAADLEGATLVGSNPRFDAAMLARLVGEPWSHRLINVADGAMWLFNWDRPKGLADIRAALDEIGYDIPEPDHTAEGDVRTTRAVYESLRDLRSGMTR